MKRSDENIKPIEIRLVMNSTPPALFRALTSQTELRKWWAPRVIMSKNIVSQEDGHDMEMLLLQKDDNRMVRYSWRSVDSDKIETVISFEIQDLGVRRNHVGEGVQLDIIHDNWSSIDSRNAQEKIWKVAVQGLKDYLEGKSFKPWWESDKVRGGFKPIKLLQLKPLIEKIDKEHRGKPEKKLSSQNIMKICIQLDSQGLWYIKENSGEFELRFEGHRIFGIMKNGNISMAWRELEKLIGDKFEEFTNRLMMEQNLEVHVGKSHDRFPASAVTPSLWNQWIIDIIRHIRDGK